MSKYQKEFNDLLKRTIYYTGTSNIDKFNKPKSNTVASKIELNQSSFTNDFNGNNFALEQNNLIESNCSQSNITLKNILINNNEHNNAYLFVNQIINHQLWRYPSVLNEFQKYLKSDELKKKIGIVETQRDPSYSVLNDLYKTLVAQYNIPNQLSAERGENRLKSIKKYINLQFPVSCYLDVGCFDGNITKSIGSHFNLHKLQIHGVDIKPYNEYENMVFSKYDGRILPYSDNSFDLITCLMVLHHVPENNLIVLIKELNRVLKSGGILILREHDVRNEYDCILLDIMHNFYDYVWTNVASTNLSATITPVDSNTTEVWKTNYKSNNIWSDLFVNNGFKFHTKPKIFRGNSNPFMSYTCSYQKMKINTIKKPLYRILPDTMKCEKYHRRTKEVKNVIHWGQRKLLLSEIEFLNVFLGVALKSAILNEPNETKSQSATVALKSAILNEPNETNDFNGNKFTLETIKCIKPVYIIYTGSAPGTHILYLSQLFTFAHFELYDPREFSKKLDMCPRIKTHIQYFTDETANEWRAENHPDKIILLISDIRTGDTETMTSIEVEECVKNDNQYQMNWYNIINPFMAMFKFRLPYNSDGITSYLNGDIYLQAYAPATSTETRLIVMANAGLKQYDDRQFEEKLFYFNNYERVHNYNNILYDIPIKYKYGIKNNYDGASEISILENYCKIYGNFNENADIKSNVIRMIGEISKELSCNRTLFSKQPVKNYKKKVMTILQNDGFIPSDALLNQKTFNIFIIPRYEYFKEQGYFTCDK
jgi:ubiquinone/menaquinone biosynthesis C-methylase UbiE